MFSAYLDETGHPDNGSHLIVAGCLASVDQWVHLEREWLSAIAPFGISIFHTVDFESGAAPFGNTDRAKRKEISARLAGIIARRCEKIFSFTIDLADYRKVNEKWIFAESYGYPYPLACRSCIGQIEVWSAKHSVPMKEILVFLEDGAKHKGQLEWIAERDGLVIPVFRKKSDLVPLQAADFIAWHLAQAFEGRDRGKYSESVVMQLEKISHSWRTMDLTDIDRLPTILEIQPRRPELNYRSKVLQKGGVRRSIVQYWRKDTPRDEKIDRQTLVLSDKKTMTDDQLLQAIRRYEDSRK